MVTPDMVPIHRDYGPNLQMAMVMTNGKAQYWEYFISAYYTRKNPHVDASCLKQK